MADLRLIWRYQALRFLNFAVKGGFIQLNHGKKAPLQRFRSGDRLVVYSPRTAYPDGDPLQALTAIGVIGTGDIYQVEMVPNFNPYRLDVLFADCREAPIKPLLESISFIKNKKKWGAVFQFGLVKIPGEDFKVIEEVMRCIAVE